MELLIPVSYSIPGTSQVTGLPRTTVYRLIAEGALDARKAGRRTLITSESIRAYLAGLPVAQIGLPRTTVKNETGGI